MLNKIFKKIINNPTLMSWMSEFSIFAHGLIVTPLILVKFSNTELSFWYLLQALTGFGTRISDIGFAYTFERAVAFFYGGAKRLPKNKQEYKDLPEVLDMPNFNGLENLLYTTRKIYLILSIISIVLLSSVGIILILNVINMEGNPIEYWIAFILMVLTTFFLMHGVKWKAFMMGTKHVALTQSYSTIFNTIKIFGFLTILLTGMGVHFLMGYLLLEIIGLNIVRRKFVLKWFKKNNIHITNSMKLNKSIFRSIWPVAWKSGLNDWGYFFALQGPVLLAGQLKDAALMASYLLTNRLLNFIRRIGEAPIIAHLPYYYTLMAGKKFDVLKKDASTKIFLAVSLLILGFASFGLLGNFLLDLIHSNKRIVEFSIFILICLVLFFDFHALIHGGIYISTNDVPFLIPSLITGAFIFSLGFLVIKKFGLFELMLLQFIFLAACNFWYSTYLSLKLLHWPLQNYARDIITIGSKYWFNKILDFSKKILNYIRRNFGHNLLEF